MNKMVIISPGKEDIPTWIEAIHKKNPDIEVQVYPEDTEREKTEFVLTWNPPEGVFEEYPNLKVIASMAAGVRHIISHKNIPESVSITKVNDPLLKHDLSYFVLTLVLNYLRNLPLYFRQQQQAQWNWVSYQRPEEVSVGILGFGGIGKPVGELLSKNGLDVKGWSRSFKEHPAIETFSGESGLDAFLKKSQVLVCLLPLTEETEGILNSELFKKLPQGAYLINVGRGLHLIEKDLLSALENEQLSGAALDVFAEEPLPQDHVFWKHEKISITPHTASVTDASSVTDQVIENFKRMKEGKELMDTISRERGY